MTPGQLREWARQKAEVAREYDETWDEAIAENELREKQASITNEQLANFATAAGFPILATPMFMNMPHWRQSMLNLHEMFSKAIGGDEEAARTILILQDRFGTII